MSDFLGSSSNRMFFTQDESTASGLRVCVTGLSDVQLHHANLVLVAVQVARATAQKIAHMRADISDLSAHTATKSTLEDPVTVVDREAEILIRKQLDDLRPGDGVIGEEGTQIASTTGVNWIVDPIDGTVNFIYGIPQYAVSIAAAVDGVVIAGAVLNVATNTLWFAGDQLGGYRLDLQGVQRLSVSAVASLQVSLVATGFGYSAKRRQVQAEALGRVIPQVRDIRRQGSAALDLCAVADGTVDAYYEHGLNAWDFAAGVVIAREAGAQVITPKLTDSGTAGLLCFAVAPRVADDFSQLMATIPTAIIDTEE